ncbi:hypothetical protein LEP1GSC168_2912 [Leptospira santarosai str. HAI134]|uniref:Uncharacterized protein n=1 Tax=Leptospira santarosai serovar Arenal str. MAVJ 401 TaxID=1049976 RepID=M6JDZ0_9LEPT|nr:hypothetical protein LEP1GSC169_2803 [Leptospira santarosai str. HAI1349]EMN20184.1 hypothetical protein LEP1GSC063_2479 [Leptospira santarosai serovar Arenal str. MAVJ 401]EMO23831.1 hypothetical protein LEP1GSC168_2912 [Leptospira santarosai str. HAI134]EMO72063.1 hypothetical protein LEP1GSC130_3900 [Leptospira santarosai str. 200403458]EMP80988.1 hypothetical protein LEP1GSC162_0920 [Leptospira santarosai str. CBC1531]
MNLFVIKEVWFRYIFSNQKRNCLELRATCTELADIPVFFLSYYVSGRFSSRIQLLESG